MYELTCKKCGKKFMNSFKRVTICDECKTGTCLICGKQFMRDWPFDQKYCSKECKKIGMSDPEFIRDRDEKRKKAVLAKYGVDNVSKLQEVKDKLAAIPKTEEYKEKVRKTSLEKYGVEHYQSSPEVKEHIKQGFIQKYGVDNISKLDRIKKLISEKQKSEEVRAKYRETSMKHYGVHSPSSVPEVREKAIQTTLERYGVPYYVLLPEYRSAQASHQISGPNRIFAEKLNSLSVDTEFEKVVGSKPFDIGIVGQNILIEVDPSYTHSIVPNHWDNGKDPDYHLKKTELAETNGFRCIHIFDWDNTEKIASMLQPKKTIYARKCNVKEISVDEANALIDRCHIQGKVKGTKFSVGLFSEEGQLLIVMTFGKPRYNKNYQWELLRLCTDSRYRIVGGASKLFKHFVKTCNPESIISYCDRAKFSGDVYNNIGMTLHHVSPPAMIWSLGNEYITDNLLRQRGYDQLFNANYGKGTSNDELMLKDGWLPVYDCGQFVFEWKNT